MPNFETFTRRSTPTVAQPLVSIQRRATISLNQAAFEALGKPATVELLFDREEQMMGFRAVEPTARHAYPVRKQPTSNSYLIGGQAFCKHFGIPTGATRRYEARVIGDVLAVDLKQPAIEPVNAREASGARVAAVA